MQLCTHFGTKQCHKMTDLNHIDHSNDSNDFSDTFDSLSIKTNQELSKPNGKPKRKNSEKRKEKSRKAARERRSQESKIFDQMEALLPIPAKNINHLDKASLIRLAINYLKIRKVIEPINDVSNFKDESGLSLDDFSAAKALNGFVLVLSREGDMIYLSEDVDKYLGLSQIDLIGQSIYDYSHPCDHNDIKDLLAPKNFDDIDKADPISADFCIRMKCTLTTKGRNLNLKSANYKVIHCVGHLKKIADYDCAVDETAEPMAHSFRYFVTAVCEPIEHPIAFEKNIASNVFVSRHSLDMKFTSVDESVEKLLGFNSKELAGKSLFDFFHALDLNQLEKFFKTLFAKGQCQSQCYRFLAKTGGYLWLLTQATVITDNHSSQPQSVVCVNHVISGVVNPSEVISLEQCFEELAVKTAPPTETPKTSTTTRTAPEIVAVISKPSFQSSTKTVFAPKTAEMESGFLVFADSGNVQFTTDADDLTHLAPEAGDDVCVPYPGLLPEFNDVNFFEEVFLNNTMNANLFADEEKLKLTDETIGFNINDLNPSTIDELTDKINDNTLYKSLSHNLIKSYNNFRDNSNVDDSPLPNDPFLSPNDDKFSSSPSTDSSIDPYSSETNSPINISSPILSQTSNFFCCKSPTEEVSKLNLNDNKVDFVDEKTLEMRAPFIPIDDFPLLLDHDLQMNATIDDLNFGNLSDDKLLSPAFESVVPQKSNCLETLLQTDCTQKSVKLNDKEKQNLNYYAMKSGTKCGDKSMTTQTSVHSVYNNINQSFGTLKSGIPLVTSDINANSRPVFSLESQKALKNCFKSGFDMNSSSVKASNASKRPHSSDTSDLIRYTICPSEVLPKDSSTKRFKFTNNSNRKEKFEPTRGNSVLMNLLVNGEDLSNGYKKYSMLENSHRQSSVSSNVAINDLNTINNNQKTCLSKKGLNSPTFEGQDVR